MSYLATGDPVVQPERVRRFASLFGACLEIALFGLALAFTLPVMVRKGRGMT